MDYGGFDDRFCNISGGPDGSLSFWKLPRLYPDHPETGVVKEPGGVWGAAEGPDSCLFAPNKEAEGIAVINY